MARALLSVSDKAGLLPFARGLREQGWEIVSTGGTARALREGGVDVVDVAEVTGFDDVLDGRVKTLHPHVHAGVLARATDAHADELRARDIAPVDLVVVNLYPFARTVAAPDATEADALERIDVGGPTLLRAAAKTFERVTVVVDPHDYDTVLGALREGGPDRAERRRLARKAFAHTAAFDADVVAWFDRAGPDPTGLPPTLHGAWTRADVLRYGENPHQDAARYRATGEHGMWDACVQHKGAEPSYLNLFDAEAAARLAHAFDGPAAAVVKHGNPCGVAVAGSVEEAYARAFAGDPTAAFGGVVAVNAEMDEATAEAVMANPKADVVVAPAFAPGALRALAARRAAMRVLEAPAPGPRSWDLRPIDGGLLVQRPDRVPVDTSRWRVVTRREPSEDEWRDLRFAWIVCAAVSSNAIVLAKDLAAVGIGAGQPSRVASGELAARQAAGRAAGGVCASDAFFPFRDGLDAAAEAGAGAVIQPGGSVRDDEVTAAADERGVAMVLTGERHFRH